MVDAGQLALVIALVVTAYAAIASFIGAWQRISRSDRKRALRLLFGPCAPTRIYGRARVRLRHARLRRALRRREQQPRHAARLYVGGILRRQCRVAPVSRARIGNRVRHRSSDHSQAPTPHHTLRARHDGAHTAVLPRHHALSRQPARTAPDCSPRRAGHQPVAGALRHVHTPTIADGGLGASRRAVQHRDGRAGRKTRRPRRVGGPRQALGHGLVARAHDGTDAGQLVGVHDTRLGRLLGVGPGRELRAHALARHDRFRPLHNGAEAARHVPHVEHGAHHHRLHDGADGHVHQPGRPRAVCAFLRPEHDGLAIPRVHGWHAARIHRRLHVALRLAQKPRAAGVLRLTRERIPRAEHFCSSSSPSSPCGARYSPSSAKPRTIPSSP